MRLIGYPSRSRAPHSDHWIFNTFCQWTNEWKWRKQNQDQSERISRFVFSSVMSLVFCFIFHLGIYLCACARATSASVRTARSSIRAFYWTQPIWKSTYRFISFHLSQQQQQQQIKYNACLDIMHTHIIYLSYIVITWIYIHEMAMAQQRAHTHDIVIRFTIFLRFISLHFQ